MNLAWMAWTGPTIIFFSTIGLMLVGMTIWQFISPTVERVGMFGIATTRGDRLFMTLLGAAFIHLGWLGLVGPNLWWAFGLSLAYGVAVFRWG
jgi:predicted small integral membrane protein